MKWCDDYATGIEHIDNQHKTIFKMAEDFQAALDEGRGDRVYGNLLQSLDHYVRTHFTFEERCMDEHQCPVAQKNIEAHVRFVDVLSNYKQRYAAIDFDRAEAHNLVITIEQWLANHICSIDMHLRQCVHKP